jgi:uncharacterized protein
MMTPQEVHARLLEGIATRQFDTLADLYAQDCVIDLPFARPAPVRLEGREAVRKHFESLARGQVTIKMSNVVTYQTTDPEVIVAEFDYDGHISRNDRTFHVSNAQVFCVRDGLIAWSRDYHDHAAIAVALAA